jgi:hypothetical protein
MNEIPETMRPRSFIPVLEKYLKNPDGVQWVYNSWIN